VRDKIVKTIYSPEREIKSETSASILSSDASGGITAKESMQMMPREALFLSLPLSWR